MANPARLKSSRRALAHIEVSAHIPLYGTACIEGGHQTAIGWEGTRQFGDIGINPYKLAIAVALGIDGNGAAGRKRQASGPQGGQTIIGRRPEKSIARIKVHDGLGL